MSEQPGIKNVKRKTKKHNGRYGLSLTIDNPRTGKKSQFKIRITNPTLRMILDEETNNET